MLPCGDIEMTEGVIVYMSGYCVLCGKWAWDMLSLLKERPVYIEGKRLKKVICKIRLRQGIM